MHPYEQAWTILKAVMIVYGVWQAIIFLGHLFLYLLSEYGQ